MELKAHSSILFLSSGVAGLEDEVQKTECYRQTVYPTDIRESWRWISVGWQLVPEKL